LQINRFSFLNLEGGPRSSNKEQEMFKFDFDVASGNEETDGNLPSSFEGRSGLPPNDITDEEVGDQNLDEYHELSIHDLVRR
jgi:hypothetical protein